MGFLGLGKKHASDIIEKYFKEIKATYEEKNGKYSYSISMPDGLTLYPYFSYDEAIGSLSYAVNLRKTDGGLTLADYARINEFNKKSIYLTAKISETGTLFLEYNAITSLDDLKGVLGRMSESVFMLAKDIDEL